MSTPPFWNENPRHSFKDRYVCKFTDKTFGYSLAEACERDKMVLSFDNLNFKSDCIYVYKNDSRITIFNIHKLETFVDYLLALSKIDESLYCLYKFEGTKLSFTNLEYDFGFEILEEEEIKTFISTFKSFSEMTWDDIHKSEGLEYKQYQPSSKKEDWFLNSPYSDKQIFKFRTSKKYRCFGYRDGDVFFALRFERDHSKSDKG